MTYDTTTSEGRLKRLAQLVREYAERHNWAAITSLIGGSPRFDLQDYIDADEGMHWSDNPKEV